MVGEISQDSVLTLQEQGIVERIDQEISQDSVLTLQEQGIVERIDQVYSEVKIWSRTITEVGFINSNLLSYKN